MTKAGVRITEVERGSPAHRLGLRPGDEILAVNGRPVPDELALRFYSAEGRLRLEVRRVEGADVVVEVELREGRNLGLRVADFKTRTCSNACMFCFIDQLPPGARDTLKVKDDDYRLSFLHGNYITLTNLADRELDRIVEQRLSPLYISVHATDPDLRTRVLGRRKVDDLDRKMRRLIEGGIELHTQVVLMPGINDGDNLEKTVNELFGYYPGVSSVAIVPLGLSEHGRPREVYTPVTASYCRGVVAQAAPWQERFRREVGKTFAYLADEFYIQGGLPLPDTAQYDDLAQIEDGIGMVRKFLGEFDAEMRRRRKSRGRLRGTLVTGVLFHPFLDECIGRFNERFGSRLSVRMALNGFMGKDITVAGLLGGRDILASLDGADPGGFVIIPNEAVSRADGVLVDNLTATDISQRIGRPVHPSGRTMKDFFELLFGM